MLRRSAAGLAIPAALATAGVPVDGFAAGSVTIGAQPAPQPERRQAMSGGLSEERLQRMHEVMSRHVAREPGPGIVSGMVTLVSRRGETHVDALGTMAYDSDERMRPDTIFRIASVTKPITAAAAMILVEECVLRLDEPVEALLPELADRQVLRTPESELDDTEPANRPITLRDLLTFRLGYGAIFTPSPLQEAMTAAGVAAGPSLPTLPPDEYMAAFGKLPLAHQPGERWLYNTGADMLGVLIARASGTSLGDFMQERLFTPLGMKDTAFSVPASKVDRLPTAYWTDFATGELGVFDTVEDGLFASPPVFESGASGLVSTVDDLRIFAEMMLNNGAYGDARLLSRPSIAVMTADQLTPEQKAASVSQFFPGFFDRYGWGFGVAVVTTRDDLPNTPGRYGWDGGYGTSWYVDPTEALIGIQLTQRLWDAPLQTVLVDFWTSIYQAIDD
jgi:CubicO group peptidase (beta-lactamase class C family)